MFSKYSTFHPDEFIMQVHKYPFTVFYYIVQNTQFVFILKPTQMINLFGFK